MDSEQIIEIFSQDNDFNCKGDNALEGLLILRKYFGEEATLICGANHDILYSVDIDDLIEKSVSEEDLIALRNLNWMIENDSYLACFV